MGKKALVYGIGIRDAGKMATCYNGKMTRLYKQWAAMFRRCYSVKKQITHPSYLGCSVDVRFHRFQDFAEWANHQPGAFIDEWELDKDVIIKGNKVYSPDTCSFVPKEINSLFRTNHSTRGMLPIGVHANNGAFSAMICFKKKREWLGRFNNPTAAFLAYKARKEEIIKLLADEHRLSISVETYAAMMSREVSVTD